MNKFNLNFDKVLHIILSIGIAAILGLLLSIYSFMEFTQPQVDKDQNKNIKYLNKTVNTYFEAAKEKNKNTNRRITDLDTDNKNFNKDVLNSLNNLDKNVKKSIRLQRFTFKKVKELKPYYDGFFFSDEKKLDSLNSKKFDEVHLRNNN